jgi:hypothetical protein
LLEAKATADEDGSEGRNIKKAAPKLRQP